MSERRARRGRPVGTLGPVAAEVLATLACCPMTAGQLAEALQLPLMMARYTCSRLGAAGVIRVVDHVRVAGAHRPVSVYAAAPATTSPSPASAWFRVSAEASV